MTSWVVYHHKKREDIRYYAKPDEARGEVRLKATRNVRFDVEDHPPHMAPEAGLWPYKEFMELYQEEDRNER